MKTEVIMKRELFGQEISQKSKSEFFSASDLVKAGNLWRLQNKMEMFSLKNWLQNKSTIEFMEMLKDKFGEVKINSKGKGSHTWIHPFLFIDLALAINPKLKVEVYSWLYDHLIKYRNNSGDSYKKMAGAIFLKISNKSLYVKEISEIAKKIQEAVGVSDWQIASEDQLKLRDRIQENIALLSEITHIDQAVNTAIKKAIEEK